MAVMIKNERGQFALELALLTPLLLVLVFLTFEFGRVFGSWVIMTNAAREGARTGITQMWCAPPTACTASDTAIIQRIAATAQFLTVQTATPCTVSGNSPTAPATRASLNGQTSCVAVVRYVDAAGDHVLQVWAVYQVQTLFAQITGAVPFLGTLGYPQTLSVTGLTSMRSTQ
jgi:Flp pilus assembly protein TadG